MKTLGRSFLVSFALAISDFISFTVSIYLAMGLLDVTLSRNNGIIQSENLEGWVALHWLLAICCVAWYSMRLRHYFYRKTFWFELKEILRTLVIFAIIEIAVMAFTTWAFPRSLWILTWIFIFLLVPISRMSMKRVLDYFNYWQRDTWIIGSGANAREAYKAISSERNLGLIIVGFIYSEGGMPAGMNIDGIPVLENNLNWLTTIDKKHNSLLL